MKSQYLTEAASDQLYDYQVQRVEFIINDYLEVNRSTQLTHFSFCPKCGVKDPVLIKSGKTQKGKQMLRCKECNRRFTEDHGQLTWYSQQSQAKWNDLIVDTQSGNSIEYTAAKLDVNPSTAFRMRHKYLNFVEQLVLPICS